MLRTRGQFRRWPRRRLSRAKHWSAGTRSAAISKAREKLCLSNSGRWGSFSEERFGGGGEGLRPLWREGP